MRYYGFEEGPAGYFVNRVIVASHPQLAQDEASGQTLWTREELEPGEKRQEALARFDAGDDSAEADWYRTCEAAVEAQELVERWNRGDQEAGTLLLSQWE
jgi:hypothetical protein